MAGGLRMRARWPAVAASYVGAIVGAGFASGREVFHFFAAYGVAGLLGAGLAAGLFAALGAIAAGRMAAAGHRHYGDLLRDACGPWLGAALDRVAAAALLLALALVVAGAGALGALLFAWPRWSGCALLAGLLAAGAVAGPAGQRRLNLIATPVLVAGALAAGLYGLARWRPGPASPAMAAPWPVAALLYVAYNLPLAIAGLSVAATAASPRQGAGGGLAGGLAVGLLCAGVTLALLPAGGANATSELPLATAVAGPLWRLLLYPALLLTALWTTGSAAALALGQRWRPAAPGPLAAALSLAVLPCALLGLVPLVAAAYPALGYAGLPLVGALATLPFRPLPALRP